MSKQFDFNQTSIPSQYTINVMENYGLLWADTRTADIYRTFFTTVADVLKTYTDKNKSRIGFKFMDDKGNFRFGAILNYRKPDEGEAEDSGNWYLEFTFYEEDMEGIEDIHDNHSDVFIVCAQQEAFNIASARFRTVGFIHDLFNTCIDTVVNFLDVNANETEEVEVKLNGVFTATVAVENDQKVMSIVPGEAIKQIIKADSIL